MTAAMMENGVVSMTRRVAVIEKDERIYQEEHEIIVGTNHVSGFRYTRKIPENLGSQISTEVQSHLQLSPM
jgi:hypothetical protein